MSTELPKTYDPAAIEAGIYQAWLDEKCFHVEPSHKGEPYCIVIPPPNVTGALHLGHAINNTLQDILTRKARMEGKAALWMPGLDHAGIATQAVVEKQLKEKENLTRHEVGREGLVERIWAWKQQYGDRIISQLKRLGCSCDWDRTRFTLDEQCAKAVRETFFKLFKDGLVFRGKKLVNWDTHLQTSISNDEIYHEKIKTHLWHIRYEIVDAGVPNSAGHVSSAGEVNQQLVDRKTDETTDSFLETFPSDQGTDVNLPNDNEPDPVRQTHVQIATTRPETLLGDTAVAVNSKDPRWNWAIGKMVKLPLLGRLIPIIADDELVDPKFGTGVVKVTPAHDPNDYAVWERHRKLPDAIEIINILNPDGTLNDAAGPYKGLTVNKARTKIVDDLKAAGLFVKEEPYETEIGHSDRSKTPIQPYLSDQWFVKMAPLAEPALQVVRDGTIQFFPERHSQQYLSWLGEKRDWPISRQLWWGHRIPVWSGTQVAYMQSDCDPGESTEPNILTTYGDDGSDIEVPFTSFLNSEGKWSYHFCPPPDNSSKFVAEIESKGFKQDPDVLDTWFSSALWPFSTLGWPEKTSELAKWYPTSVLLTGRDIITLWVARMVMMGMYNLGLRTEDSGLSKGQEGLADSINFGAEQYHDPAHSPKRDEIAMAGHDPQIQEPNDTDLPSQSSVLSPQSSAAVLGVPFAHVAINPTILDEYGKRMSKSAGNGVDPVDIIETHGSDALRFTLATMATETQDARMPVKIICPHCGTLLTNPESVKIETVTCTKCKKTVTRTLGTAKGTADAPLGRMTSEKFDMGRNFCNKLWNASRFVLATLEQAKDEKGSGSSFILHPSSLANRWILSRFAKASADANSNLAVYRFDLYAKACYDFFWGDFCDWYLESTKVLLKNEQTKPETLATLVTVLDGALRLMHPVIPFITETLWQKLNDVAPNRPQSGTIHKRLILSEWAKAPAIDEDAEHVFPRLQEIIGTIRNLRNEHKVDPKKPVTVSIVPPGAQAVVVADQNRELIETLATCTIKAIAERLDQPAGSIRAIVNGNCDLYVEGLSDPAAQAQLNDKKRADLTKQIAAMEGRLANDSYIAKAPPKLVEETKQKLAEAKTELAKLG